MDRICSDLLCERLAYFHDTLRAMKIIHGGFYWFDAPLLRSGSLTGRTKDYCDALRK